MSKETYHTYYQEYQRLLSEYAQRSPSCTNDDELQHILQLMRTEARYMSSPEEKEEYFERTLLYQQNVVAITQQQRSLLRSSSNSKKESVLKSSEDKKMTQQNETLQRARRTILETEEISFNIQDELAQNRTTLQSSHSKIQDLADMTQQASAIIKNMTPWWRR